MTPQQSSRIMVLLSMLYGITIGAFTIAGVGVGVFAIIGAMVLGFLWVARSMLMKRDT
jgi:hypothetical protein